VGAEIARVAESTTDRAGTEAFRRQGIADLSGMMASIMVVLGDRP
jgi:hypothetical protein